VINICLQEYTHAGFGLSTEHVDWDLVAVPFPCLVTVSDVLIIVLCHFV